MGTTVVSVIGLLLALYGAADLSVRICYGLLFKNRAERDQLVLVVETRHAEYRLRRLALWRNLIPDGGYDMVVVYPSAMPQVRVLCEELGITAFTEKEWNGMRKSALQSANDGV